MAIDSKAEITYLRGFLGNTVVAEESIALSKTSTWTGTKIYSELVYCDYKINYPSFETITVPQVSTLETFAPIKNETQLLVKQEQLLEETRTFLSGVEALHRMVEDKYKEEVPQSVPSQLISNSPEKVKEASKEELPAVMKFSNSKEEALSLFKTLTLASLPACAYFLEIANWNLTEAYQRYSSTPMAEYNRSIFFQVHLPNGNSMHILSSYSDTVWDLYVKVHKEMEKIKMAGSVVLSYNGMDWTEKVYSVRFEAFGLNNEDTIHLNLRCT